MTFIYPLLVLSLLLLLRFASVTITIQAFFNTGDGTLNIKYHSWPGFRRQSSYPISQQVPSLLTMRKSGQSKRDWTSSHGIVLYSIKHSLRIQELKWHTVLATGDAMTTALGTGSLWAIKGSLITYLSSKHKIHHLQINISPDFNGNTSSSELFCIFKIRLVHIIHIIACVIVVKIRRCKNGFTAAGKPQPSH